MGIDYSHAPRRAKRNILGLQALDERILPWASFSNVVAGDFNGDGRDDLFLRDADGRNVAAYARPIGQFYGAADAMPRGAVNAFADVVAGDFNGDGRDDVFFRDPPSGWNRISYATATGKFSISDDPIPRTAVNAFSQVLAGDFDGDGRHDLLFRDSSSGWNRIVYSLAANQFSISDDPIPRPAMNALGQMITGDFNSDGRDDLFLRDPGSGWNRLVYSLAGKQFSISDDPIPRPAMNAFGQMMAGDFNGDGRTDIFLRDVPSGWNRIAFSLPGGQFSTTDDPIPRSTVSDYTQLVSGNFNGDGRDDLFLRKYTSGANRIVYSQPSGQFVPIYDSVPGVFDTTSGSGLLNVNHLVSAALGRNNVFSDQPYYGDSLHDWNLNMIEAPEAWAAGYSGQNVIVAVVDSGVDYSHSDLDANILRDVSTGKIIGYDFIDNDADPYPGVGESHGTHVAGTIAAERNGVGATGVAYSAKIMPIRVLSNGTGSPANVVAGILWAADHGARVINLSLGSLEAFPDMEVAINYAAQKGAVVVMASGNDTFGSPGYPAAWAQGPGIAVGAVNTMNDSPDFSNKAGSNPLDYVVAPGVNVYSTVMGSLFGFSSGTSMSAPHVSGAIALALGAVSYSPSAIEEHVIFSAMPNQAWTGTAAAKVIGTVIGGSTQRSNIRELTIDFDSVVNFAGPVASAFTLARAGGGPVAFTASLTPLGNGTRVTLNNFTGTETENGSLRDGTYTLTALAAQITGNGQALDGSGTGVPGSNYTLNFHRLFGDSDGDGDTDTSDFAAFRGTFGGASSIFDFDNDGDVDTSDYGQFRARFGMSL